MQFTTTDTSDFIPLVDEPFIIPKTTPVNTDICFRVDILGDNVCEESELFSITVMAANLLDTITGSNEADITVFDNGDSKWVG